MHQQALWVKRGCHMRGDRVLCIFLISFLLFFQWDALLYGDDSSRSVPESLLATKPPLINNSKDEPVDGMICRPYSKNNFTK
jgi:hypothetical protein